MKSVCSNCKSATNHSVLNETVINVDDEINQWWEIHKYQIIKCLGCDSISFRKLYNDIAQNQGSEYVDEDPWTQKVFPKRTLHSLVIRNVFNTPQNVKNIYRETIEAFNNGQFVLCSGGLRSIIEGICKERGIVSGSVDNGKGGIKISKNLDGKIEGLNARGFLTLSNSNILHELRFLGNEALHDLTSPSMEELKLAIDIIEHTLIQIYELESKAVKLKTEIAKRKK